MSERTPGLEAETGTREGDDRPPRSGWAGVVARTSEAVLEPGRLRRSLFLLVISSNVVLQLIILLYAIRFVPPDHLGWFRPVVVAFLVLQLPAYLLVRRGDKQPVYFGFLLLSWVMTVATHVASGVPLGDLLGLLVFFEALLLFVALVLLEPAWFLSLAGLVGLVTAVQLVGVIAAEPDALAAGKAAMLLGALAVLWSSTSAVSLLLAGHRRKIAAAQAELAAHNQRLADEVAAQTALIAEQQRQLFEATKLEALGTLAGGAAHDFNNLLHGIASNVEFLQGELQAPEHLQELELIRHCVDSGAELVRDLMGYARTGEVSVGPLPVRPFLTRTVHLFGRAHKGMQIELRIAEGIPPVLADQTRLQQVLLNILDNAADATKDRGAVVVDVAEVTLDDAPAVRIRVRDDGPGLDEETAARVFEPFFTTKPEGRGTGLGLASAWGIVTQQGGRLAVSSAPGEGATFDVLLPAGAAEAPVAEASPPPAEAPVAAAAAAPPTGGADTTTGHGVLVVDDEPIVCSMSARMLKALGYRSFVARTAADAEALLTEHRDAIGLVLLDMVMPDTSGPELFERLRAIKPEVAVVLSTGYAKSEDTSALLERGCEGVLAKPYGLEDLRERLGEVLGPAALSPSA